VGQASPLLKERGPTFSPSQGWAFLLSGWRRPGSPTTLAFLLLFKGGPIGLRLRATFSPAHPLARRDVPLARARVFQLSLYLPLEEGAKAALYCAHRTSTVSSCAFCEQGGHLATPPPSLLRPRVARAKETNGLPVPSYTGRGARTVGLVDDRTRES
jgi:hypothetical protein